MVKCINLHQIYVLLKTKDFSDPSELKIPVLTLVLKPPEAKDVIYNVPKDIADDNLLSCLKHQKISFIRRFVIKNGKEKVNTKTVTLHFNDPDLPEVVNIG